MPGVWDTPPTEDEMKGAQGGGVWDTPPSPEELGQPKGPRPGFWESAASGAGQGLFGLGDEIGAGLQAFVAASGKSPMEADQVFMDTYRQARSENRQIDEAAREQHPEAYYPAMLGTAVVTAPALPGLTVAKGAPLASRLATAATNGMMQGAAFGAGASEADLTRGEVGEFAGDVGAYGLGGGALGVVGGLAGEGLGAVSRSLGERAAKGAAERGAQEAAELVASARGSLGAQVQQANRLVENLQRLKATGNATPEQLAKLEQLKPVLADLERRLLDSSLRDLPGMAADVEGARAGYQALAGDQERLALEAAARIASPGEALRQVGMRAKRYGLPAIGSALGGAFGPIGGVIGAGIGAGVSGAEGAVGALAGAGLRPMGQALLRMATHPSIAATGSRLAGFGAKALGAATSAAPALERDTFMGISDILRTRPQALGGFAAYFPPGASDEDNAVTAYTLTRTNPEFAEQLRRAQGEAAP